ncbi:hypothetical protein JTE90_017623 [Oedothorax gibbosus]|uniref:Uncharacterized protein n=1 Tax=Oedothorax gibbosus TaxID=931172 RepID=A0AAV6U4R3_9ARAC|nr:hypothetical protein JTE90_017623 [Oedothorax gibbosus]
MAERVNNSRIFKLALSDAIQSNSRRNKCADGLVKKTKMIPKTDSDNQQEQFTNKTKVKQKSFQPYDPISPLHPQNFHSNYGQTSYQTKSESSNYSYDCESFSSRHSRSDKNLSTASQTSLPTEHIDYIPSVYALPISCSGYQSKIGCEFPSVIPPPKSNRPTQCESSTAISNCDSVSSGFNQSENDFFIASRPFSPGKARDFIPAVYALPISFSVANQANIDCNAPPVIPAPHLNPPIANQNEVSQISGELDLLPQKVSNARSSNVNGSQIKNLDKTNRQVISGADGIPPTQSGKVFLDYKVINSKTESSSCEFTLPSLKDCARKSYNFPDDKTVFQNCDADIPTPRAYDVSSLFRDQKNKTLTGDTAENTSSVLLTGTCDPYIKSFQHSFENLHTMHNSTMKNQRHMPYACDNNIANSTDSIESFRETTNLSFLKSKKQRKCVMKNSSIETSDLFSGEYLSSLIELGAMSLNKSGNELSANNELTTPLFLSDEINCDSTMFTNKSNEDALIETPVKVYQEQYLKFCDVEKRNNAYYVDCIKNLDSNEPNSNLYVCKSNSDQLLINSPHNHSNTFKLNASFEDKISTENAACKKLFFEMPSKSIDSGLGSLSQENLTVSSSDIPSIYSEKSVGSPVNEHVSNQGTDTFSAYLQRCAFDEEDLREMERIDNVVDEFFALNPY